MNQFDFIAKTNFFKDKLYRLAKRLLVSNEEAEDATQEVLVKLWNHKSLEKINSLEAMAMTINKNYCLDQLKSKRAQNLYKIDDTLLNNNENLHKNTEDKDSLNWVEKIINQLPEQQRLIVQLREIEQYEFDEIEKILDMNQTAIRVALSRARKTIKENMSKTHNYGL